VASAPEVSNVPVASEFIATSELAGPKGTFQNPEDSQSPRKASSRVKIGDHTILPSKNPVIIYSIRDGVEASGR
jgi:hypothetical protein